MDEKTISEAIKKAVPVLQKGDRVELIPVKDGVKVMRVRREELNFEKQGELYAQGFMDGLSGCINETKNLKKKDEAKEYGKN